MDEQESYNKALTFPQRQSIQDGITEGLPKAEIGRLIGKDKSTVGKEIRLHRYRAYTCKMPLECAVYRKCVYGRECTPFCQDYVPFNCKRRDRTPGACNGCPDYSKCRFDKFIYEARRADREYHSTLSDSRTGVNLTAEEAKKMAGTIKPLLDKGQSPYSIILSHPELHICEKTLYNYINKGVFSASGIMNIDLRRKVRRRLPKKQAEMFRKRKDRSYIRGRTYDDYKAYMAENPHANVLQMDTVYNDVTNGPFIQTFKFIRLGLMVAFYHTAKTAGEMTAGVDALENILGPVLFNKYAEVCVTDRGAEFTDVKGIEIRADGSRRTRLYFCDPMQSGQKGSLEENHTLLRYILPKKKDLYQLGLVSQEALNLVVSHIASYPVESLSGKTPIAYTKFMAAEVWDAFQAAGMSEIPAEDVTLVPGLLKKFRCRG